MTTENDRPFRDQIVGLIVEALREQGYPDLSVETIQTDTAHRDAFVEMLEACRPLPVIRQLITDAKESKI
jgi:hypothetical protein